MKTIKQARINEKSPRAKQLIILGGRVGGTKSFSYLPLQKGDERKEDGGRRCREEELRAKPKIVRGRYGWE
jgi:hypothetical protein